MLRLIPQMSDIHLTGCAGDARLGVADLLSLAAAPTFATLTLFSGISGNEGCGAYTGSGMGLMYGVMAAFHLPPWLKLVSALYGGEKT